MMLEEKLLKIIKQPYLSEKVSRIGTDRQYVFKVHKEAKKPDVKKAVELLFKVHVDSVRVSNVKKKPKRFGRANQGYRKGWKKVYVTLKEGNSISYDSFPVERA